MKCIILKNENKQTKKEEEEEEEEEDRFPYFFVPFKSTYRKTKRTLKIDVSVKSDFSALITNQELNI